MGRIKLNLPDKFIFSTEIQVRISDINYGGHLGNDSLLSLIHEARIRFLKHFGYTELNIEGSGIIMTDSVILYKSEVFHGEVLHIEVAVDDIGKCGCDVLYRITGKETGKEVARAKTGIVFYDYEKKKVVEMPVNFKSRFF